LSGLIAADAARAVGFLPDEGAAPDVMLRAMCVRCHADNIDARLTRSRFNAAALDRLDAQAAREIVRRITLPRTAPDRMPPLRAGELSASEIDRIVGFLSPLGL
jgi:mono/diheme cytochrome c family protein